VTLAGQTVIVTRETLNDLDALQRDYIGQLALLEEQIEHLENTNPSHPKLGEMKKSRDALVEEVRKQADTRIMKAVTSAGIVLLPGAVGLEVSRRQFKGQLDDLVANQRLIDDPALVRRHGGKPYLDPYTGQIVADARKISAAQLELLSGQAAKRQERLYTLFETSNVRVRQGDGPKPEVSKDKDGYVLTLGKGQTLDGALDTIARKGDFDFQFGRGITKEKFQADKKLQERLYNDARQLRDEQEQFATGLRDQLGIQGEVKSILKRDKFGEFVAGIAEKMGRKGYSNVYEMDDIVRGRMDLGTQQDVLRMVKALSQQNRYGIKEIVAPRAREGVAMGYPRFHVILRDPKTGLTHEWQIGTKAVTRVFEKPGITIPGKLKLKKGMHTDIHDIEYDIFKAVQDKHKELAKELGIPAFRKKVAEVAAKAGKQGSKLPEKELEKAIDALHKEAAAILEKLVEKKGAKWVEQFYH
jgi:hypothetical protein